MVGMFLSVFIVALTLGYMVTSSRTFDLHANELRMQENARLAFALLAANLRRAGGEVKGVTLEATELIVWNKLCPIISTHSLNSRSPMPCAVDEIGSGSDRLAIRFASTSVTTLCDGSPIREHLSQPQFLTQLFWVGDFDNDGEPSLYCQSYNDLTGGLLGRAVPLVDGVSQFQFQLGVDTDRDGAVDQYNSVTHWAATNPRGVVKAIRIGLLVSAGNNITSESHADILPEYRYQLFDSPVVSYADGIVRQIFSTTIMLPNAHSHASS